MEQSGSSSGSRLPHLGEGEVQVVREIPQIGKDAVGGAVDVCREGDAAIFFGEPRHLVGHPGEVCYPEKFRRPLFGEDAGGGAGGDLWDAGGVFGAALFGVAFESP